MVNNQGCTIVVKTISLDVQFAEALKGISRSNMATDIEKIMIKILDNLGYRYYEQYELIPYIVDFYLPEFKIAIEADGDIWHTCRKDMKRDIHLMQNHGIRVLHFVDKTIKKLPITVAMSIQKEIDKTIYKKEGK